MTVGKSTGAVLPERDTPLHNFDVIVQTGLPVLHCTLLSSTVHHRLMTAHTVQCSAVQCIAVHCSTVQYSSAMCCRGDRAVLRHILFRRVSSSSLPPRALFVVISQKFLKYSDKEIFDLLVLFAGGSSHRGANSSREQ